MPETNPKPVAPEHTASFLKLALGTAVWFAHKAGAAIADIERVFAEVVADVKAEAAAEIAEVKSEL